MLSVSALSLFAQARIDVEACRLLVLQAAVSLPLSLSLSLSLSLYLFISLYLYVPFSVFLSLPLASGYCTRHTAAPIGQTHPHREIGREVDREREREGSA